MNSNLSAMVNKLLLSGLLLTLVAIVHYSDLTEHLTTPSQLRDLILDTGEWGYVFFLLSFILVQPLGIPGFIFVIAASLVWPAAVAFLLSIFGSLGAAVVGFCLARYLAREWVAARLPARFHRFDNRLGERSFYTVILVYLVFFLAPPAHWLLGLSKVRFTPFLAGSAIGTLPGICVLVFLGETIGEWLGI